VREPTPANHTRVRINVCVKGMDFGADNLWRLVEWMEAQRLFGADHVDIYVLEVRSSKVLVN
jgi:hypothetical protein